MKTVLVTGGTVRIGKAVADRLRSDGWRVITSSSRAGAGADIAADLSDPMGPARLYAACLRLLGGNPPDAIVNNAGLFTGDEATLRAVNLDAPRKLATMLAGREAPGRGAVVNVLDCKALGPARPDDTPYLRTKRELLAETRRQAALFADTLRVNAVAPGPVLAPRGLHVGAGETPVGRPRPGDVADAVSFLLGAEATTGCVVPVDGGQALMDAAGSDQA